MPAINLSLTETSDRSVYPHTAHVNASVVLDWNQQALDAIQATAATPPFASRALALESIAVFDVLNAIQHRPGYLVDLDAPHRISSTAAVAAAAKRILSDTFPDQKAVFAAELTKSLEAVPDGPREARGVAFGNAIADAVIAVRADDGSDRVVSYDGGAEPGEWRPTPPSFLPALLPQWGSVTPFALAHGDQFRPDGPPDITSAAYAAEFNEVKRLGATTSSERSADQTEIALFWADGPGSYTPPGHWNQIATEMAAAEGLSGTASARLLAELNVALADAAIAAWDAKYTYGSWRPVTAIRLADTDGNAPPWPTRAGFRFSRPRTILTMSPGMPRSAPRRPQF